MTSWLSSTTTICASWWKQFLFVGFPASVGLIFRIIPSLKVVERSCGCHSCHAFIPLAAAAPSKQRVKEKKGPVIYFPHVVWISYTCKLPPCGHKHLNVYSSSTCEGIDYRPGYMYSGQQSRGVHLGTDLKQLIRAVAEYFLVSAGNWHSISLTEV